MSDCKYRLADGDERARQSDKFEMPRLEERQRLRPGDRAKLIFEPTLGAGGERMWVKVTECLATIPRRYAGTLENHPVTLALEHGDHVDFGSEHIIDIEWAP